MVVLKEDFNLKEEVPTTRFWLMLKLKLNWDKRWEIYLHGLKTRIMENMTCTTQSSSSEAEKKNALGQILTSLERSAWATMPSSFLSSIKVERVIRR